MEKWQDKALLEIKKKMRIVDGRNISAEDYPEKRDCYPKLYKYITEHNPDYNGKICALYGLRRTGKTVMMNQCISELPPEEKEKSVYILCKETCDMLEMEQVLDELYEKGKRLFFIDEVTLIEDLQVYGNVFSDYYRTMGAKIVIAGTDSFGIYMAKTDILYDRTILIHTSQIPYAEFKRICKKDLDTYIEYGGTLTNTTYKNNQNANEYLNTAIVENILHGLEGREEKRKHATVLTELYDRNELVSVIQKMINRFSYEITMKAINRSYKSAPLYATYQTDKSKYQGKLKIMFINDATKSALGIKNNDEMQTVVTQEDLEMIKKYLRFLDLYITIPTFQSLKRGGGRDLEILQQPGMIYAHATELLHQLEQDNVWNNTCEIEDKTIFMQRADQFVKGILLENIILSETYKCYQEIDRKRFYVSQLSDGPVDDLPDAEADLIIVDMEKKESYLFEIKHSDQVVDKQTRHLRNEDFINYISENFAPVKKCCVIYNGQPTRNGAIDYLNAEKFLMCIHEMDLSKRENLDKLFQTDEIEKEINPETKSKKKKAKKNNICLSR